MGYDGSMKSLLLLGFVSALLSLPLFAADIDPRVLEVMRKEQSEAQSFCYSFLHEGGNGVATARACLESASDRYFGNYDLAAKDDAGDFGTGTAITRAHSAFCAAIGKFPGSGTSLRADCETWNRSRAELFKLGSIPETPASTLGAKIERTERYRIRFCQALQNAGNPGDPSAFSARLSSCYAMAKLATATDRAILLGAF
jgi:hypothetical protein